MLKLSTAIVLTASILSACNTSQTETRALRMAAISDAQAKSKELKLAYLNCYALPNSKKDVCRRRAQRTYDAMPDTSNWNYVRPFNHELERLGFIAFLQDNGKNCDRIDEGVKYLSRTKHYVANCVNDKTYNMRFENGNWVIVE